LQRRLQPPHRLFCHRRHSAPRILRNPSPASRAADHGFVSERTAQSSA
jgi:hypothetical protein